MSGAQVLGDLSIAVGGKTLVVHSGPELVRDRLYVAFGMARSTYRFNGNAGFPYLDIFDLRGTELLQIQSIFTKWLLDFDFISAVDSVTATFDSATRHYSITFSAASTDGPIEETFTFAANGSA